MALDFKRLGPRQVRARLTSGDLKIDEELSRIGRSPVYVCPDGQALVLLPPDNRSGMLYSSHDELRGWMRLQEVLDRDRPMLPAEILRLDETFLQRVPDLIAKLPIVLEADIQCDYSVASVERIDGILRSSTPGRQIDTELVLSVWAYVGEVIRRQTDGRWQMKNQEATESPEPMITDRAGKRRVGVAGFYHELLEFSEEGSLTARVLEAIDYLRTA